MRISLRIGLVALLATAAPPRQALGDDAANAPEALHNLGQAAFERGDFGDAIAAWRRSYALSKEPALLFNLGQAYRLRAAPGDCRRALEAYQQFVALDPSATQRAEAEGHARALERCVPEEASASSTAALPSMTASTDASSISTTTLRDSEPRGRTKQIAGLAVAGTGGLLTAAGLYFGHRASSLGDEVTDACEIECDWAVSGPRYADAQRAETTQYVLVGLGVTAIAGGGVLYWLGTREVSKGRVAVTPNGSGATFTWSSTW